MFFRLPESAKDLQFELQALLDKHYPSPEGAITHLCNLAAATGESESDASFRRMVVDIDSLLMDIRWSIGQALLILRAFPDLEKPTDATTVDFGRIGMPNRVWVLIRPLVIGRDRIFYSDLLESRPGGGTVGGWMLHLLIEDAISRAIGVLDRLAHLVILAAKIPAPRGKMYFRSGKLELIKTNHGVPIPDAILDLAKGEDLAFLLNYRDGLAHTRRSTTRLMGSPPVDNYTSPTGWVNEKPIGWTGEQLVGLGVLGFHLCSEAMPHIVRTCEHYITPRRDT